MKKLLFTTALCTLSLSSISALAKSPDVNLSGFARFQYGFFDDNYASATNRDAQMESEIHIKVKNTTESGLEYGAKVELKTSTSDTTAADEVTIWLEGIYGRLEVGDQDGAADTMAYYAPKVGFGGAVDGDFTDWTDGASKPQIGSKVIDSKDSTKITYYSPRIEGFQIGISYAPELNHGEKIIRDSRQDMDVNARNGNAIFPNLGQASNTDLIDHVQPASSNNAAVFIAPNGGDNVSRGKANKFFEGSFRNFTELGINFVGKYHNVDVNLAFGLSHAEQKGISTTFDLPAITGDPALTTSGLKRHPIYGWHAGGKLKWFDFTVGGSYVDNLKSGQLKRLQSQQRSAWNIGLAYQISPVWEIGTNYITEDLGGVTRGNGNYYAFGLSTAYRFVPGMMLAADFVTYEREFGANNGVNLLPGQTRSAPSTLKAGKTKDQGHVVILGTKLDF